MREYEIVRPISAGGMGTVYLGRLVGAHGFTRVVALKSMHPQYALDPNFAAMFVDEARITALLRHPNIVPTIDVVQEDGSLTLVMEYVEGSTLWQLLERAKSEHGEIPLAVAGAIVHDMLTGLHHAHEANDDEDRPLGLVHRDVSPQNLMVGKDGLARVLDFGIAKACGAMHASHTGAVRGKVAYMAPEQLAGKPLDRRADVWAAGVVLFEALTGTRLFQGENLALVSAIMNAEVRRPSEVRAEIPAALDDVVLRALAKNPEDRFPTAAAMADALAQALAPASRSAVARFVTKDLTLASARPSWVGSVAPRTSTSAIVVSRTETSVRLSRGFATDVDTAAARRTSPFTMVLAGFALALVCALGVMVGARRDAAPAPAAAAPVLAPPPAPVVLPASVPAAAPSDEPAKIEAPKPAPSAAPTLRAARPARPSATTTKPARFDASLGF